MWYRVFRLLPRYLFIFIRFSCERKFHPRIQRIGYTIDIYRKRLKIKFRSGHESDILLFLKKYTIETISIASKKFRSQKRLIQLQKFLKKEKFYNCYFQKE